MHFLPLYREDSKSKILVLTDPQDKNAVLALYLQSSWWAIEDVVKTTDPFREGLIQVQTFAERIVLFVLNFIIFGMLERSLAHDVLFVPHSKKERAKIFWTRGEAVAFYTIKAKGSLCDGLTSQCYLLPVLDTMFVRKKFRRCGLVCQKFLEIHPEEQSRLWEVEAPGDWSQRVGIWLKIQLERNLPREVDSGCPVEKFQDDEPWQSDETWMNKRDDRLSKSMASLGPNNTTKELNCEPEDAFNVWPHDERVVQCTAEIQKNKGSKKRASCGEPSEVTIPKHFKVLP
ncbi:hypothetical protein JD844_014627 [Phrynosoma platyrhinos]|uniref:Uncharacterized protein n=1 Tax=Phrynosoma platyrhinos TaxID=52577 RepID=A0ABQ7SRX2_PHRPL|nr:hypothetical protein JD844_014627 [Phrynosoma platyrhinos]